jgi:UTP-glucose-1-phosphate uridylyltransferase
MGEEAFVVLMGDAFVNRADGSSELADAVKAYQSSDAPHLMLCAEVPKDEARHYGLVRANKKDQLEQFLEKPSLDQIPSPALANLNQIIFDVSILEHLEMYMAEQPPKANAGEYFLTDVIQRAAAAGQAVQVKSIQGEYLDAGNTSSWLKANNRVLSTK